VIMLGDGFFLLRRLCPGEDGEGFHSFEGPLAGSMSSTAEAEDHVWFEDRWMVASLCDE
jgi:hypothetical protein